MIEKKNIFCCDFVPEKVSNSVDFEGVMVLIVFSVTGRWWYGTSSVSNSTESGGVFF